MAHDEIICPSCEKPTNPYSDMGASDMGEFASIGSLRGPSGGMVQKCGNAGCGAKLPPSVFAPKPAPRPAAVAPALALVMPSPVVPAALPAPLPMLPETAAATGIDDILAAARARLTVIDAKIAEAEALRPAAEQLRRMLAAAEPTSKGPLN